MVALLNPLTTSSVPVIACDAVGRIADGTGFIARGAGVDYLVTNRHVVTGLHNITRRSLDEEGGRRPTSLRWIAQSRSGAPVDRTVDLYDAELTPRWREHPQYGASADIVAIPLGVEGATDLHMAEAVDTGSMSTAGDRSVPVIRVTNTVFVVGYPRGHSGGLPAAAVWTQGTIASELDLNVLADYPTFFIDSTTHEGLSGAPVYALTSERTLWRFGNSEQSMGWSPKQVFLGIYSGRAWNGSNLGYVWKATAVDEVIQAGVPAEFPQRDDS